MRLRDWGLAVGSLPPGPLNAITDVSGVRVGHRTVIEGQGVRTGVTAIWPHPGNPFEDKAPAAVYTINGFGKATGFEQVRELGTLETPVLLTSTLCVPRTADALVAYLIERNPSLWSVNPVVGECNDRWLNDGRRLPITADHVREALATAQDGAVAEGCVGAGTGVVCYQFKGGIGTASRRSEAYTVGALVQTNFGLRAELMVLGVPVGQHLADQNLPQIGGGSVMIILATDAPLTARQLTRLCKRAAFGLARTGTVCHNGSGDFVIAFSTAYRRRLDDPSPMPVPRLNDETSMDGLFQAVVESVEEAVYNSLTQATTLQGHRGNIVHALPHDALRDLLVRYGRL